MRINSCNSIIRHRFNTKNLWKCKKHTNLHKHNLSIICIKFGNRCSNKTNWLALQKFFYIDERLKFGSNFKLLMQIPWWIKQNFYNRSKYNFKQWFNLSNSFFLTSVTRHTLINQLHKLWLETNLCWQSRIRHILHSNST